MGCLHTLAIQLFMPAGIVFSLMTFIDCRFVTADLSLNTTDFPSPPSFLPQSERQGYGFIWFENPADGKCWWDFWGGTTSEQDFNDYYDFIGDKWHASMGFAVFSSFAALLFWILSLILVCLPHAKCLRYALGSALVFVLSAAQGVSFVAYASSFCNAYACEFGQTAGFCIGALLCYFLSGVLVLTGEDYRPEDNVPKNREQRGDGEAPQQNGVPEEQASSGNEQLTGDTKPEGEGTPVIATVY